MRASTRNAYILTAVSAILSICLVPGNQVQAEDTQYPVHSRLTLQTSQNEVKKKEEKAADPQTLSQKDAEPELSEEEKKETAENIEKSSGKASQNQDNGYIYLSPDEVGEYTEYVLVEKKTADELGIKYLMEDPESGEPISIVDASQDAKKK